MRLRSSFQHCGGGLFRGHAVDEANPNARIVVEIRVDGHSLVAATARLFDPASVSPTGDGDGHHGFVVQVPAEAFAAASVVDARVANSMIAVGEPFLAEPAAVSRPAAPGRGHVSWRGGRLLTGWLPAGGDRPREVRAVHAGETVARASASHWWSVELNGHAFPVFRFDLWLPPSFADGQPHGIAILAEDGSELAGSPVMVATASDGDPAQEDAATGDVPIAEYAEWRRRLHAALPAAAAPAGLGFVVVGRDGLEETRESLTVAGIVDTAIFAATSEGQLTSETTDQPALRRWVDALPPGTTAIVFCKSGLVFSAAGLMHIAAHFREEPGAALLACSYEIEERSGHIWPVFHAACDSERQLEQGYVSTLFALSRGAADKILLRAAANLHAVAHEAMTEIPAAQAHALAAPAGSIHARHRLQDGNQLRAATQALLRRSGVPALLSVEKALAWPRVRVVRKTAAAETTIVVLSQDNATGLRKTFETIAGKLGTADDPGFLVLDNASADPRVQDLLGKLPATRRVLLEPRRSPAALANEALRLARTRFVCLIQAGLVPESDDWLAELAGRACVESTAVVAPLVLSGGGAVVSAGMILTETGPAPAFDALTDGQPGYTELLTTAHRRAAASGGCLLLDKSACVSAGAFDVRRFPGHLYAVDLCLRLARRGFATVFTPHARLRQHSAPPPDLWGAGTIDREREMFRRRWSIIADGDPWYPRCLSRRAAPYDALSAVPRTPLVSRVSAPTQTELPDWL